MNLNYEQKSIKTGSEGTGHRNNQVPEKYVRHPRLRFEIHPGVKESGKNRESNKLRRGGR